ncbi:MAG: peptidylprolyl isomerase [Nitrospinota bacterium]
MKVESGDIVKVDFTARTDDGFVIGSSNKEMAKRENVEETGEVYKPLILKAGVGQTLKGVDEALIGMHEGEKKEVIIPPEKGFGPKLEELVKDIPKSAFEGIGLKPEEGMTIKTVDGDKGMVKSVGRAVVNVDFNHPLAGRNLIFDLHVLDIEKES